MMNRCSSRWCASANMATSRPVSGSRMRSVNPEAPRPLAAGRGTTSSRYSPARGGAIGTRSIAQIGHFVAPGARTFGCIGHQNVSGRSVSAVISMVSSPAR